MLITRVTQHRIYLARHESMERSYGWIFNTEIWRMVQRGHCHIWTKLDLCRALASMKKVKKSWINESSLRKNTDKRWDQKIRWPPFLRQRGAMAPLLPLDSPLQPRNAVNASLGEIKDKLEINGVEHVMIWKFYLCNIQTKSYINQVEVRSGKKLETVN